MPNAENQYDVIIAGAGPVGLTLAIDLGRRGVKTLIMERNPTTGPWPKMDRTNARSMEMFRRIGLADRIRELGYPADNPMDVFLLTKMSEPALAVLKFGSVAERRAEIAACTDGSLPLEPYQLVSQNWVEPLLKEVAEGTPNVTVRYAHPVVDFEQDEAGVDVKVEFESGETKTFRGSYLVGCDGGVSTVRKKLGVKLEGRGRIREQRQVIIYSHDLYDKIVAGKGRHYTMVNGMGFVAQGDRKEFTVHTSLPEDADFRTAVANAIGLDVEFEIRKIIGWWHNLLLAEHYGEGRVLMAGDAIHLVIPTGGLGMNSGMGDAFDLSWKLAGAIKGWGGPGLLPSYEQERRPVGVHNVECSGWAADGVPIWMALVKPEIYDDTPEGEANRKEVAASFNINHARMHGMRGAEFGYTYAGSPLIAFEPDNEPAWDTNIYTPHTRPGVRLPHMWLKDGSAMQDVLGDWWTVLDLKGDLDTKGFEAAFKELGAPFEVKRMDEPHVRETYGKPYFLLRPDLHIAWRGDAAPADAKKLVRMAAGWGG
ncbi:MAG: FAD-dependent monooxygenase [Hyphomonadaceae bacterium]